MKKSYLKKSLAASLAALITLGSVSILGGCGNSSSDEDNPINLLEDTPIKIREGEKHGFVDSSGKIIVEPVYDYATEFYNGYACVGKDTGDFERVYKIVDKNGNDVITAEKDISCIDNKCWVIDDTLYDLDLQKISDDGIIGERIGDNYFTFDDIEKNKTFGVIDYKGKKIFKSKTASESDYLYVDTSYNSQYDEEYAVFDIVEHKFSGNQEKWGIYSPQSNKMIYDFQSEYNISDNNDNLFSLSDPKEESEMAKYIFIRNDEVFYESEPTEAYVGFEDDGGYILCFSEDNKTTYYNIFTKETSKNEDDLRLSDDDFKNIEGAEIFIDEEFREPLYEGSEYIVFEKDDKYGLAKGEEVILPAEYDDVNWGRDFIYTTEKQSGQQIIFFSKENKDNEVIVSEYDLKSGKIVNEFNGKDGFSSFDSIFCRFDDYQKNEQTVTNYFTGKSATFSKDDLIQRFSNYFIVLSETTSEVYNADLEKIYSTDFNEAHYLWAD